MTMYWADNNTSLTSAISSYLDDKKVKNTEVSYIDEYVLSKYNDAAEKIFKHFNRPSFPKVTVVPKEPLRFKVHFSPLKFVDNISAKMTIKFINDFEPTYLFYSTLTSTVPQIISRTTLNADFEVVHQDFVTSYGSYFYDVDLSGHETLFLYMKLYMAKQDDDVGQLFPEFFDHGVYDFTSDSFTERLEIFKMMFF